MFRRVLLDHWMFIFPLVAFITAATVYAIIAYKALRMPRHQIDRFAQLPFHEQTSTTDEAEV